jgi:hypothetical protein
MLRLIAAILLMIPTTQTWAEKRYNSPKAKACRAEAAEKFPPTKWVPLDPSKPDGLKTTESHADYKAHYRECMKRSSD